MIAPPQNPLILAVDTSSSLGSVALWRGGAELAGRSFEADHGHSRQLLPAIDAVLTEAEQGPSDVDRFAVVIGPGSFTGLRVSLACIRGLAGKKPCYGALATQVAAWAARGRGVRILAVADLFHGEVFGGVYDSEGTLISRHESGEITAVLAALKGFLDGAVHAVGSAAPKHRGAIEDACQGVGFVRLDEGLAPHLASLAAVRASEVGACRADDLLPFYLRDPLTRGLLNSRPKEK